jgi:hypothetical protein
LDEKVELRIAEHNEATDAATKVQAVFRGWQVRVQGKGMPQSISADAAAANEAMRRQAMYSQGEALEFDIFDGPAAAHARLESAEVEAEMNSAASFIQAQFRGLKARRAKATGTLAPLKEGWAEARAEDGQKYYFHAETQVTQWDRPIRPAPNAKVTAAGLTLEERLEAQILHHDEENGAALSLQAMWRGYLTRKGLRDGTLVPCGLNRLLYGHSEAESPLKGASSSRRSSITSDPGTPARDYDTEDEGEVFELAFTLPSPAAGMPPATPPARNPSSRRSSVSLEAIVEGGWPTSPTMPAESTAEQLPTLRSVTRSRPAQMAAPAVAEEKPEALLFVRKLSAKIPEMSLEEKLECQIAEHNLQVSAVVKLQSHWRGVLARRARKNGTLPAVVSAEAAVAAAPTVDVGGGEEFSLNVSTPVMPVWKPRPLTLHEKLEKQIDQHEEEVSAVTKLQSVWRGTQVRRGLKNGTIVPSEKAPDPVATSMFANDDEGEEFDLPLYFRPIAPPATAPVMEAASDHTPATCSHVLVADPIGTTAPVLASRPRIPPKRHSHRSHLKDLGVDTGTAPTPPALARRGMLKPSLSLEERLEAEIANHNSEVEAVTKLQSAWRGTQTRRALKNGTLVPSEQISPTSKTSGMDSRGETFELDFDFPAPPKAPGFPTAPTVPTVAPTIQSHPPLTATTVSYSSSPTRASFISSTLRQDYDSSSQMGDTPSPQPELATEVHEHHVHQPHASALAAAMHYQPTSEVDEHHVHQPHASALAAAMHHQPATEDHHLGAEEGTVPVNAVLIPLVEPQATPTTIAPTSTVAIDATPLRQSPTRSTYVLPMPTRTLQPMEMAISAVVPKPRTATIATAVLPASYYASTAGAPLSPTGTPSVTTYVPGYIPPLRNIPAFAPPPVTAARTSKPVLARKPVLPNTSATRSPTVAAAIIVPVVGKLYEAKEDFTSTKAMQTSVTITAVVRLIKAAGSWWQVEVLAATDLTKVISKGYAPGRIFVGSKQVIPVAAAAPPAPILAPIAKHVSSCPRFRAIEDVQARQAKQLTFTAGTEFTVVKEMGKWWQVDMLGPDGTIQSGWAPARVMQPV